jgi:dihydrofolate synthase / folylpolyglutamate synthase
VLDGAHNPQGAAALAEALPVLYPGRPVELVFGVLSDKDHAGMLAALRPAVRRVHVVAPQTPRGRPAAEVEALARSLGIDAHLHGGLGEALDCARRAASGDGLVCIAGSLYLVGEARQRLGAR